MSNKKLLLLLLIFFTFAPKAQASSFSVGIYPPIIQIQADPPVDIQTPILINNPTDQVENLDISFKPFMQSDSNNGQVQYIKPDQLNLEDPLMFQRIKVFENESEVSSIQLSPKQQKKLTLRISIPKEENISDYYFSILFTSSLPTAIEEKNKSDILTGVATNVLLSIGSKGESKAEISEFTTSFFQEEGPIKFSTKVSNLGKHFTDARGFILIKNIFGQTVGRVDLTPVNILAETERYLTSENQLSDSLWPEKFILGPYTATLTMQFGENGTTLTRTSSFIGAPVKITITSLIVISLILLVKRRVKSKLKR